MSSLQEHTVYRGIVVESPGVHQECTFFINRITYDRCELYIIEDSEIHELPKRLIVPTQFIKIEEKLNYRYMNFAGLLDFLDFHMIQGDMEDIYDLIEEVDETIIRINSDYYIVKKS